MLEVLAVVVLALILAIVAAGVVGMSVFAYAVTCDTDDEQLPDNRPSAQPPTWWNGFSPFSGVRQAETREAEELRDLREQGIILK